MKIKYYLLQKFTYAILQIHMAHIHGPPVKNPGSQGCS